MQDQGFQVFLFIYVLLNKKKISLLAFKKPGTFVPLNKNSLASPGAWGEYD